MESVNGKLCCKTKSFYFFVAPLERICEEGLINQALTIPRSETITRVTGFLWNSKSVYNIFAVLLPTDTTNKET